MSDNIEYFSILEKYKLYDEILTELDCVKSSVEQDDIEKIINKVKDNILVSDLKVDLSKLQLSIDKLISNNEFNCTKEIILRMIDIYKNSIIVLSNQSNLVLELNNILQYKDNCDNDECSKTIKTLISDLNNNFKLLGAGKYEKKDKFFYRYLNYPVPRDCYSNITRWETSCLTVPKYQLFCDNPDQFKEKLNQLSKNKKYSKNNYVSKIECAEMEINVLNNDQNSRNSEGNDIINEQINLIKKKLNEMKCLGRKSFTQASYDNLPDWLAI